MSETLETMQFAVIDLEGNGQQPPEIVEIAVVPMDGLAIQEPARTWLVKPRLPITPMVSRIHGIKNGTVEDAPSFDDVSAEILDFLGERIPVAHNARIDHGVLSRQAPGWSPTLVIDTLRLAKAVWPGLQKYALDSLIETKQIDLSGATGARHRAGYDAYATALLFVALAEEATTRDEILAKGCLPGFAPATPPDGGMLF